MKRYAALLLAILFLLPALVNIGYSFFIYTDGSASTEVDASGSNASLEHSGGDEYYRIYFFASPYYATGAEIGGKTVTDPLLIAESPDNPYDSSDEYMLVGKLLYGPKNTAYLYNKKYANAIFADGNYHYISYKSKNVDVLAGALNSLELFEKKDYTGYIRANETLGIEKTSTYVSLTVKGNITMEQLGCIVAATEFKDSYGFGPEFVGWTFDKSGAAARAMYGTSRYNVTDEMTLGDSRGYKKAGVAYQLGNFGCQGEIEQITSTTSLKAIDKTTDDGSQIDDKIIYLYPVFTSKNYSASKSLGGTTTPILKFRVNPDASMSEGMFYYEYKQAGEIDYSIGRYTSPLFQRMLDADKSNVNYYIDNLYFGADAIQLDVCPTTGNSSWANSWTTLLTDEDMHDLGLKYGYYNVDITFVQLNGAYDGSSYANTINALLEKYRASGKYVKLYSSLELEATGVVGLVRDRSSASSAKENAYFVVGFQKVEELRLVGDTLNDSLTSYNAEGYDVLNITVQFGSGVEYIIESIYLGRNCRVSVLTEFADGRCGEELPYTFAPMDQAVLDDMEDRLNVKFIGVGTGETDRAVIVENNVLIVKEPSNYTLIFSVHHEEGVPTRISVAYRPREQKFSFIVLAERPTEDYFTDREELADQLVAKCEVPIYSYLNLDTVLTDVHSKSEAQSMITSIRTLLEAYAGMRLIDTATGIELSRELFERGAFCLNRDYVLYFTE